PLLDRIKHAIDSMHGLAAQRTILSGCHESITQLSHVIPDQGLESDQLLWREFLFPAANRIELAFAQIFFKRGERLFYRADAVGLNSLVVQIAAKKRSQFAEHISGVLDQIFVTGFKVVRSQLLATSSALAHDPLPIDPRRQQAVLFVPWQGPRPAALVERKDHIARVTNYVNELCIRKIMLDPQHMRSVGWRRINPAIHALPPRNPFHDDS